jgi:AGCS family alanine or glycine:cation symporter
VVIIGIILMAVRFAEVYLGSYFGAGRSASISGLGGPMLYLKEVPGGKYLAYIYALACMLFGLLVGNAVQTNTIRLSLATTWGVPMIFSAVVLGLFTLYVVFGGAKRVAALSEKIVPLKVAVFFSSSLCVLAYHYDALWSSLQLVCSAAFSFTAVAGGVAGFTVGQAMRFGMSRSIMATESGIGTAAILFGSTGSKDPVSDGIMSMVSTLISTMVCFLIGLSIIASGVWTSGLTSSALTIAAYDTAFGAWGGWLVSFLSITFGAGVLVAFAYITQQAWLFVTGGRYFVAFNFIYAGVAFLGALVAVDTVWLLAESVQAIMLVVNLFGLVCLLPVIQRGLAAYSLKK